MPSEFRPTLPGDGPQLARLAQRLLGVAPDSPMFSEHQMRWKYWSTPSDAGLPRGYVLVRDGTIVAHAAVLPLRYRAGGGAFTLLHPFDWMSEPSAIGSGAALLSRLAKLADGLLIVGGSETTRRMVGPLGFRASGEVSLYAAPALPPPATPSRLRPLDPATLSSPSEMPPTWSVERQPAWLEACRQCPAAPMELLGDVQEGGALGAVMLAFAPGQARIAAFWSASAEPSARARLLGAARQHVAGRVGVDEVVCMANAALDVRALEDAGFRVVDRVPMFVLSPRVELAAADDLAFQMLDGDFAFLHDGQRRPWLPAAADG